METMLPISLYTSLNGLQGHPGTQQWFICQNIQFWWLSDLGMLSR